MPNLLAIRPEKQFTCDDKKILLTNWCATAYQLDDYFVINQLGLTDPFLARTKMAVDRPAHKFGLIPLAEDLVQLRCQNGFRKGMFADGFQSQSIPVWIEANKEKLIQIEEKIYNHHNFIENLRLAFTHINAIIP